MELSECSGGQRCVRFVAALYWYAYKLFGTRCYEADEPGIAQNAESKIDQKNP